MAYLSKLHPSVEQMTCKTAIHPWTDSCILAGLYTWLNSCIGSAGFFAVVYFSQYLSKVIKKKKKVELKGFLRMHLQSTLFASTLTASTFISHCMLRKLLGKFYFISLVFLPAIIGGQSIHIDSRKSRELFTYAFANCCLEQWLRNLENAKIIKWTSNTKTAIFMFLSSFVSFLLRWTNFNLNYFWFFMPPTVTKSSGEAVCFHEGDCKKNILNLFAMYSSTGLMLQLLKVFLTHFKNPKLILPSLMTPKSFALSAFLGGYVCIYQAIRCFLYQKEKKYSLAHDSLAGFLAGVAFRFQPAIPIFNSAVITAFQILTEIGCQRKLIPNIPYLELSFSLFAGFLMHYRIVSDNCPRTAIYFMSGVTHGFSDRITQRFQKIIKYSVSP